VIIDLTPVREGSEPARLLDMVSGRSKQVFTDWLSQQSPAFRDGIEVVAMDGFTGFKTATTEALPDAVAVMDPFHVVALASDAWTAAASACNKPPADTEAAPATRSTASETAQGRVKDGAWRSGRSTITAMGSQYEPGSHRSATTLAGDASGGARSLV